MNSKGQGALEYLLLIGGAVLVAAIVIALLVGLPGGSANPANQTFCAGADYASFGTCSNAGTPPQSVTVGGYTGNGICCPLKADGTASAAQSTFARCAWTAAATC